MSLSLQANANGRSEVVLSGEPSFIVPLLIAPPALEEVLRHGRWLVMSFSVWSLYDLAAANRAIELAKRHAGLFRLGLRPFDYYQENLTWLPLGSEPSSEVTDLEVAEIQQKCVIMIKGRKDASPLWATLIEGKFLTIRAGQLAATELDQLAEELLATSN